MTKVNYDPILGCTGWDFKNPYYNYKKKKRVKNKIINKNKL